MQKTYEMQIDKIKELGDKERFSGTFAVTGAEVRQTKSNKDFLSLTLVDKTGSLPAKVWGFDGEAPLAGTVWSVDAEFSPFKGQAQAVVRSFAEVDPKAVDKRMFIACLSPEEFTFYQDECERLIGMIQDDNIREFIKFVLWDKYQDFGTAVGAKSNHHARIGGLLEHSVNVTKLALAMAEAYRGTPIYEQINFDILIGGGLVHDIGKLGEYSIDSNTIEFSSEGLMVKHYDTNSAYLMEAWVEADRPIGRDVLNMLFHICHTHHGIAHSNRPPSSISAWLVSAADGADCFIQGGIDAQRSGGTRPDGWTKDKIWMLGNQFFDESTLNANS